MMRNKGFSLLEVLIAMAILTVGATSLLALFASAATTHKRSVDRTNSAFVAEELISEVQARYLPWSRLDELETSLLLGLSEKINGYYWTIHLVRPGELGDGPTYRLVHHGGASLAGAPKAKKKSPFRTPRTTVRRPPPGGRGGDRDPDGDWSVDELLVRVEVSWTEKGTNISEHYDTILIPRPVVERK